MDWNWNWNWTEFNFVTEFSSSCMQCCWIYSFGWNLNFTKLNHFFHHPLSLRVCNSTDPESTSINLKYLNFTCTKLICWNGHICLTSASTFKLVLADSSGLKKIKLKRISNLSCDIIYLGSVLLCTTIDYEMTKKK
jgi:hypothetical protein